MRTSKAGIDLIKSFEGFSPKACKCVKSEKYYTIGYGHYGADVSEEDAKKLTAEIEELYPDVDVDTHLGGQPIYYYVIAVE